MMWYSPEKQLIYSGDETYKDMVCLVNYYYPSLKTTLLQIC